MRQVLRAFCVCRKSSIPVQFAAIDVSPGSAVDDHVGLILF
jgi:hypothetical protein